MANVSEAPVITGLNIFPIKSCKGCKVSEIVTDAYGVVGDRRFMVVDGRGRFISQRKYPKMALIEPKWSEEQGKTVLRVNAPGMQELVVFPVFEGERQETTVWDDSVMTIDQGQEASDWFSRYLEIGASFIRLVASAEQNPGYSRYVSNFPTSLRGRLPPSLVHLGDAAPVSLISNESLADLNQKLNERVPDHTVTLDRFRMNIEITGCSRPFEEDEWLVIQIASTPLLVYVANERCKITGVNQDTGVEDKLGPLEVLRQYRAPEGPAHAKFGQYMIPLQRGGTIRLGDTVKILDRKK